MSRLERYRMMRAFKGSLPHYDLEEILGRIGLARKSVATDVIADFGYFALGCVCGALAGVLFAPARGIDLRTNVKKALEQKGVWTGVTDTIKSQVERPA